MAKLRSLDDVEQEIQARGQERGVRVYIYKKIASLSQAKAMLLLLEGKIRTHGWIVKGIDSFKIVEAMDEALVTADSILGDLIALTDPDAVVFPLDSSRSGKLVLNPSTGSSRGNRVGLIPALDSSRSGKLVINPSTGSSRDSKLNVDPGTRSSCGGKLTLQSASSCSREDKVGLYSALHYPHCDKLDVDLGTGSFRDEKVVLSRATGSSRDEKVVLSRATGSSRDEKVILSSATGSSRNEKVVLSSATGSSRNDKKLNLDPDKFGVSSSTGLSRNDNLVASATRSPRKDKHRAASKPSPDDNIGLISDAELSVKGDINVDTSRRPIGPSKRTGRQHTSGPIVPVKLAEDLRDVGDVLERFRLSSVSKLGERLGDLGAALRSSKMDRASLHAELVRARDDLELVWSSEFNVKDLNWIC